MGPNIQAVILDGRLDRHGRLGLQTYRIEGDHIIMMLGKIRLEINYVHPGAFSTYLLRRHIVLNRKLARRYPQYAGNPLGEGLRQLQDRGLIRPADPAATLYELTEAGLARSAELERAHFLGWAGS